ncbi:hypothetical protein MYVA_2241 [Mycolicibacterium vaccae 95051]|nr:hypothetical protein MYVA_2241 [Mycolicibacterium vaccae 95051]
MSTRGVCGQLRRPGKPRPDASTAVDRSGRSSRSGSHYRRPRDRAVRVMSRGSGARGTARTAPSCSCRAASERTYATSRHTGNP